MISDGALLDNYVASFEKLDDMAAVKEIFPIAWELAVGDADEYGEKRWRPVKVATDSSMLEPIYAQLPARFPRLYEELLLSYRWAEVDLGSYTLLANPLGPDLSRLQDSLYMGPNHLWKALVPAGYVQFAKGPDVDFDLFVSITALVVRVAIASSSRSTMKKYFATIESKLSPSSRIVSGN